MKIALSLGIVILLITPFGGAISCPKGTPPIPLNGNLSIGLPSNAQRALTIGGRNAGY